MPAHSRHPDILDQLGPPTNASNPGIIKFSFARDNVATYDHIFGR